MSWNWNVNETVIARAIVIVVVIVVIIANDILNLVCRMTMENSLTRRRTSTFLPKGTMFFRLRQVDNHLRQEVTSWRFKHFFAPLNWHRTVGSDDIKFSWYQARYNGLSCHLKKILKLTPLRRVCALNGSFLIFLRKYLTPIDSVVWCSSIYKGGRGVELAKTKRNYSNWVEQDLNSDLWNASLAQNPLVGHSGIELGGSYRFCDPMHEGLLGSITVACLFVALSRILRQMFAGSNCSEIVVSGSLERNPGENQIGAQFWCPV